MTIFVMFFVELLVIRRSPFSGGHTHSHDSSHQDTTTTPNQLEKGVQDASLQDERSSSHSATAHTPGKDHLSHQRTHIDPDSSDRGHGVEDYAAQLTAIFILEFGVIFHSIFIGLTLAVSGEEFKTLYVVLVFHQTFEGLGLGSRLAAAPWPPNKRWTPYILGVGYGISTPIAIAIGLAVRDTYAPGSAASLIANGVFDSISAGILIYTGLVELMAHEFMFSEVMRKAKLSVVLGAFGYMCLGAGQYNVKHR